MPSTFSIGGLISGLDFNKIITQLIAVDRSAVGVIEVRQDRFELKKSAFEDLNTRLGSLKTQVQALNKTDAFNVFTASLASSSATVKAEDILSATADKNASPGNFAVVVNQLAEARRLSSKSFSDASAALSLSGDILINGKVLAIKTTDSLQDIKGAINTLKDAGVIASIVSLSSTDNRLVITSNETGADKFFIQEASTSNMLQSLGLTDGTSAVKTLDSSGSLSDAFTSTTTAVGSLLKLTSPQSGSVTINAGNPGSFATTIDLSKSLTQIRDQINTDAGSTVAFIENTTKDGVTTHRLRIAATNFTDANNALQTLGVLVGGQSSVAEVLTGSVANTTDGSTPITATTTFNSIFGAAVVNNDTITIQGTDRNGNAVSGTFTVSDITTTQVQGLLTQIETVFSSNVTASVTANGEIRITDDTAGDSQLTLKLIANNEGGGTLDFGDMVATTQGYAQQIVAGQDAKLTVDGVAATSSSNTVDSLLQGVTLNLKKADSSTTVTVQIDRDVDAISASVQGLVDAYNDIIEFMNTQNIVDPKTDSAGILQGDITLMSVRRFLTNALTSAVSGITDSINALSIVGITSDRNAKLSLDSTKLKGFLLTDFTKVRNIFLLNATTTDKDVDFVFSTKSTKPGTFGVNITQLATLASVTGTVDLSANPISVGGETLTITDKASSRQATISFSVGDTIDVIVDAINTALDQKTTEIHVGSVRNTIDGSTAIAPTTTFSQINGAGVVAGDTISFSGTNRFGVAVSGSFTIDDPTTDTIQDFMSAVETAFDHEIDVSLDDGFLVVQETQVGDSQLTLVLTENNEGLGSLDFGTVSTANSSTSQTGTEGRFTIPVTASKDGGNQLVLTADAFGSANGFTTTLATKLGITAGSVGGLDVTGTINGESATGAGQVLTGDGGENAAAGGLSLSITGTTTGGRGTITLTQGVAEQLDNLLAFMTSSITGTLPSRLDQIQDSIDFLDERIEKLEDRLEVKRERLTNKFVALEVNVAQLQTIDTFLAQSLLLLTTSIQS